MNLIPHYGFNERADLSKARQFERPEQIVEFLRMKFSSCCSFGVQELTTSGQYREAAINYDFRSYLTHYLIERQHGGLQSAWAPNKGLARKALGLHRNDRVLLYPTA